MESVEVTVHYLEMLAPSNRSVPAPRDGLTVLHISSRIAFRNNVFGMSAHPKYLTAF